MSNSNFWKTKNGFVAFCFIGVVTYFLLMEHRQHIFQALPFLIILLCPLMHLFMHGGHGSHAPKDQDSENESYQRGLEEGRKQTDHNHYH